MADWRINEKYRKPRRAKGTPFFKTRNYWALGLFAISGITLVLIEYLPMTKKLRQAIKGEKFDYSEGLQLKIKHTHLSWTSGSMEELLAKAREREANKHEVKEKINLCSVGCSTLHPMCKDDVSSNSNMSKYFKNTKSSIGNGKKTSDSIVSPYKNSLSEIKLIHTSDDDFKTPKANRKAPNIIPKNKPVTNKRKNASKRKKATNKTDSIFKRTKDNFEDLDMNPNHLQMALALSKSTYEAENPGESKEEDIPTFLCPEKIPKLGTTLERYGFVASKHGSESVVRVNQQDVPNRRKYSRFKFIKPTLLTRTNEERESLIKSKVSLLLNKIDDSTPTKNNYELFSSILKKIRVKESKILRMHSYEREELVNFDYFLSNLKIPRENALCGCLLKNWADIEGRDKSPDRYSIKETQGKSEKIGHENQNDLVQLEHHSKNEESENTADHKTDDTSIEDQNKIGETQNNFNVLSYRVERNTCISPDLFDSDCESFSPSQKLKNSHTISKIFESDNGVEHFEGYDHINQILFEKVYNLTQHKKENNISEKEINISTSSTKIKYISENEMIQCGKQDINLDQSMNNTIIYDGLDEEKVQTDGNSNPVDRSRVNEELLAVTNSYKIIDSGRPATKIVDNTEVNYMELDWSKNFANQSEDDDDLPSFQKYVYNTKRFGENNAVIDLSGEDEDIDSNAQLSHQSSSKNKINESNSEIHTETSHICKNTLECVSDKAGEEHNRCNIIEPQANKSDEINSGILVQEELTNLTQSSDESDCENVTSKFSHLDTKENSLAVVSNESNNTDLCIKKLIEDPIAENHKNMKELDMYEQCEISIHSENVQFDQEIDFHRIERTSMSRKSLDYSYSELNVTEYIVNMLNSQQSTDDLDLGIDTEEKSADRYELSQGSSQESIVISDEELNYSSLHSRELQKKLYDLSDDNDCEFEGCTENVDHANLELEQKYECQNENDCLDNIEIPVEMVSKNAEKYDTTEISPKKKNPLENGTETTTDLNGKTSEKLANTPTNKLIIKTRNVTPPPNYDQMDSPQLVQEFRKFGMKPLKRKRGIMLLKYIYESTHPIVPSGEAEEVLVDEEEEANKVVKKRKKIEFKEISRTHDADILVNNDFFESMFQEELIFERRKSSKIKSCRIPLQIAWHNFLLYNQELRKNILLYEPLQVEVVNSMLKEQSGCNFHLEDLITFLDRKCITFRTSQSQGSRTKKRF